MGSTSNGPRPGGNRLDLMQTSRWFDRPRKRRRGRAAARARERSKLSCQTSRAPARTRPFVRPGPGESQASCPWSPRPLPRPRRTARCPRRRGSPGQPGLGCRSMRAGSRNASLLPQARSGRPRRTSTSRSSSPSRTGAHRHRRGDGAAGEPDERLSPPSQVPPPDPLQRREEPKEDLPRRSRGAGQHAMRRGEPRRRERLARRLRQHGCGRMASTIIAPPETEGYDPDH